MNILLDTCTFLWAIADDNALSLVAREVFSASENELFLSAVSAWEITVKNSLGKLPLPQAAADFISHYRQAYHISELPLYEEAVAQLSKLPTHHRDPFDRMLVCQSVAHGLVVLTPDPLIKAYPIRTLW